MSHEIYINILPASMCKFDRNRVIVQEIYRKFLGRCKVCVQGISVILSERFLFYSNIEICTIQIASLFFNFQQIFEFRKHDLMISDWILV